MSGYRLGRNDVVEIGSNHGKIAVFLTESEAIDLAHLYGMDDRAAQELMQAVEVAYPLAPKETP